MRAQLNHTIVWCHDRDRLSKFLAEMLGLPQPRTFLHFEIGWDACADQLKALCEG